MKLKKIYSLLSLLIANMGSFVDEIIRGQIRDRVTQSIANDPSMRNMDTEACKKLIDEKRLRKNAADWIRPSPCATSVTFPMRFNWTLGGPST